MPGPEGGGDSVRRLGQALQAAGRGLGLVTSDLSGQVKKLVPAGWSGDAADTFTSDWSAKAAQARPLAAICTYIGQTLVDLGNALDGANQQASQAQQMTGGPASRFALPSTEQKTQRMLSQASDAAQQARAAARAKLAGIAVPRIGPPLTVSQVTAWAQRLAPPPGSSSHGGLLGDLESFGQGAWHFAEGFVGDGLLGTLKGLGDLAGAGPLYGDPSFAQTWEGIYLLAQPIATPGAITPQSAAAWESFGKSLLAWDEWRKDPARAAGNVSFNIVTAPFIASKVLKLGTAGEAAAGAAKAGKAGTTGEAAAGAAKAGKAGGGAAGAARAAGSGADLSRLIPVHPGLRDVLGNPGFRATEADRAAFLTAHDFGRFFSGHLESLMGKPGLRQIHPADLAAGSNYTSEAGVVMNNFLRGGDLGDLRFRGLGIHDIRCAVSCLNQLPRYEGWASRSLDRAPEKLAAIVSNYQVGQIVTEPSFTSASKTVRLAGNLKFYIYSKNFRELEELSFNPSEQEVAVIPGTAFKVLDKIRDAEGTWHIKMIEVSGG